MEHWTKQGDLYVNTVAVRRKSDHRTFAPHTCHIYKSEQKEYEVAE